MNVDIGAASVYPVADTWIGDDRDGPWGLHESSRRDRGSRYPPRFPSRYVLAIVQESGGPIEVIVTPFRGRHCWELRVTMMKMVRGSHRDKTYICYDGGFRGEGQSREEGLVGQFKWER